MRLVGFMKITPFFLTTPVVTLVELMMQTKSSVIVTCCMGARLHNM